MASNTAPIKWAQRSDSLYITIALADVTDETIQLTDTELHFKGTSEGKLYEVSIKFFKPIDSEAEGSTYKVSPKSVQMHVLKKDKEDEEFWPRLLEDKLLEKNQVSTDWSRYVDEDEEFWPRLLEDKLLEKNQVSTDWSRYVDEDEEEEGFDKSGLEGGNAMGGMPPGMAGGMPGGMGGMPGMGGMRGMGGGMPGMEGMGGMPGMEGMGGMDMEALMKQMGAMGGGAGGMPDMSALAGMGGMGGMPGMGGDMGGPDVCLPADEPDSDDDDEDDLPDLE
eukprot:584411_1